MAGTSADPGQDPYVHRDEVGAAGGVAPLGDGKKVPVENLPDRVLTTTGARPVGKGELLINAVDNGIQSGSAPIDNTAALQALIDTVTAKGGGIIAFPPGSYRMNSVTVKSGVHLAGLGSRGAAFNVNPNHGLENTVNFVHVSDNTGAMLRIAGGGISITNIALRGNDYPATGFPLMHVLDGFEFTMAHVNFFSKFGTVLLIDHMNNNHWLDVKITDGKSVDGSAAVVLRGPTEKGFASGENNTVDFAGLTIERYIGGPQFDIAYGKSGNYWAEFVRILHLHVEAEASKWPAESVNAESALVRIGNVMGLEFVSPFIFGGGPVPLVLVQRQMTRDKAPLDMGVRFIGGQLLGTKIDEDPYKPTPTLVDLRAGNDVAFIGTQFGRCTSSAIVIRPEFGANVTLDPSTTIATSDVPLVIDNRPANVYRTWTHQGTLRTTRDVLVGRHVKGSLTLGVGAVTVGPNAGSGGTISVVGTDLAGQITITTGSAPAPGGIGEIAFAVPYDRMPVAQITPVDRATAALRAYGVAKSDGTGWAFGFDGTPAAATTYRLAYQVLG